jgi:hypothetical protein
LIDKYPMQDSLSGDGLENKNQGNLTAPSQDTLEPSTRREIIGLEVSGSFSGPLPPPAILKAYDLVEPGLASRITGLAERQAVHRMALEKAVVFGGWSPLLGWLDFRVCSGLSFPGE